MPQQTTLEANTKDYRTLANAIRILSIDAVQKANSGHPGMPMGMADIATVLFHEFLNFNPQDSSWPGRDRFILSNGHGSMLLYSLLHLTGYKVSIEDIQNFRQLHSNTPGHPEFGETDGVETTTGPLGQGLANAVGMAIASKKMAAEFGENLFANKIYVSVGDGCLMEGISHEACDLAGHLQLNNLIILFDDNSISIDGKTDLATSTKQIDRFKSYGFKTLEADGHNTESIRTALNEAQNSDKPTFIAFKTHIGFGSPAKQDTSSAHGSPLGDEEIAIVREKLGWPHKPFEIPKEVKQQWLSASKRCEEYYQTWQKAYKDSQYKSKLTTWLSGEISPAVSKALDEIKLHSSQEKPSLATRKAGSHSLSAIHRVLPNMVSGSADLTSSVLTKSENMKIMSAEDFSGDFIHYGVREHAMAGIMNGISLFGGLIPVSGTFLSFADYCKPAIRLSALMKQRIIYVMTHDSIGVGEDGPTHQPVDQIPMLRSIPNLYVFRPADQIETAECYELALNSAETPSVMCLTRQNLPTLRTHGKDNLCAKGAYILKDCKDPEAILIATGSEVHLAVEAYEKLKENGVQTRVVSAPCLEFFDMQDNNYRELVLPPHITKRISIEAASETGWHKYIGVDGIFIGMTGFGASAPAEKLYKYFGITVENIVQAVKGE